MNQSLYIYIYIRLIVHTHIYIYIYTKVIQKCLISSGKLSINYSEMNLPGMFWKMGKILKYHQPRS